MISNVPTYYTTWPHPTKDGIVCFGVWDARAYDQQKQPQEQVEQALFVDTMTVLFGYQVAQGFLNVGIWESHRHIRALQQRRLAQIDQEQRMKPPTQAELDGMSAWVAGLGDVDLNLTPEGGDAGPDASQTV